MGCPQGCLRHGFHDYIRKSFAPDEDELSRETRDMEPEAPEDGLLSVPHPYGGAATTVSTTTAAPSSRRPPYAVAYALQGGAQYEIALPGDATVRAEDGALIVTHDSAVLALTSVRPMEGQ